MPRERRDRANVGEHGADLVQRLVELRAEHGRITLAVGGQAVGVAGGDRAAGDVAQVDTGVVSPPGSGRSCRNRAGGGRCRRPSSRSGHRGRAVERRHHRREPRAAALQWQQQVVAVSPEPGGPPWSPRRRARRMHPGGLRRRSARGVDAVHGDVDERGEAGEHGAIAVEEVEQHLVVVGHDHHLGRATLATAWVDSMTSPSRGAWSTLPCSISVPPVGRSFGEPETDGDSLIRRCRACVGHARSTRVRQGGPGRPPVLGSTQILGWQPPDCAACSRAVVPAVARWVVAPADARRRTTSGAPSATSVAGATAAAGRRVRRRSGRRSPGARRARRAGRRHPGVGRRPCWPAGVVGSITHCAGPGRRRRGPRGRLRALGIDAEPAVALDDDVVTSSSTPAERARLDEPLDRHRRVQRQGGLLQVLVGARRCAARVRRRRGGPRAGRRSAPRRPGRGRPAGRWAATGSLGP